MLDLTPYLLYIAIGAAVALVLALICLIWAISLQRRLAALETLRRQVMLGGGPDLESLLHTSLDRLTSGETRLFSLEADLASLIERQKRDLQHVGIIRFNPYQDTGGDQSFSIALLDAHSDGVVITGLYARQGVRLYAKPIHQGASPYPLTDEEKQAMAMAHRPRETTPALSQLGER